MSVSMSRVGSNFIFQVVQAEGPVAPIVLYTADVTTPGKVVVESDYLPFNYVGYLEKQFTKFKRSEIGFDGNSLFAAMQQVGTTLNSTNVVPSIDVSEVDGVVTVSLVLSGDGSNFGPGQKSWGAYVQFAPSITFGINAFTNIGSNVTGNLPLANNSVELVGTASFTDVEDEFFVDPASGSFQELQLVGETTCNFKTTDLGSLSVTTACLVTNDTDDDIDFTPVADYWIGANPGTVTVESGDAYLLVFTNFGETVIGSWQELTPASP